MKTPMLVLLLASALPAAAQAPAARVSASERAAASHIRTEGLRADIRFLASDALEGRGPGSRGDELARLYLAARMEAIGLAPAGAAGSYFQPFELVGVRSKQTAPTVATKGSERLELGTHDAILFAGNEAPESTLSGAEVVFVGYGITAPEFHWDDFKGADLKGKVLVFLNNDPEDDPKLFGGRTRLYYGRYDYKFEQAALQGAAAAFLIHTEASAGYGWQVVETGWSGEKFRLPGATRPRVPIKAWISEGATQRLFSLAGQNLAALVAAAQKRDFKPVPLGVTLDAAIRTETRKQQTANVVGKLAGSDPRLSAEAVLYTAHHDHLGINANAKPGEDAIYNGAHDNASGVAQMLAVAEAMAALPVAPKRSVIFAAVGVEEQGLLGSEYLAAHPPVVPGRIAANINIDGIQIFGRTRDLTMVGLGKSNLDDRIKALAAMQGRVVVPDQFPDKGFFYRSDQFNLARIGVPAAYFDNGTDVIGKPAGWGKERIGEWEEKHYHQVSDQMTPDWNFDGAIEDGQLCFYLGVQVANALRMPAWKPGDEFEAARKKALAEAPPIPAAAPPAPAARP